LSEIEWNHYENLLCVVRNVCHYNTVKYEKHHIIPSQLETHPLVAAARQCSSPFKFNRSDNLLVLEKYVAQTGQGRHGNHPRYNDWVRVLLNNKLQEYRAKNNNLSPDNCKAKELIEELVAELLQVINSSKKPINQIGDEQLKLLGL
jgi:hypothetical protein